MDNLCMERISLMKSNSSFKDFPYFIEVWKKPDSLDYLKLFAYATIIIGGLLGNICVILTVALNRSMRTTINLYITNLAVADAFICVICMVPHAITVLLEGDIFVLGEFMCKFNPFTQMMCLTCSVLTLCAIACDRFMAILFPLHQRVTKHRPSVVMTIIWIISIIVSIPFLLVKKHVYLEWQDYLEPLCSEDWPVSYHYDEATDRCTTSVPLKYAYYIGMSLTLFFLPIAIMISAYSLIIWRLWSTEVPGEQHEANVNAYSRSKKKVIKMVFTVLIAFVICWTPLQANLLYSASGNKLPHWYEDFEFFSYYIAFSNSFINPIIYGGFNQSFRDGFCIILQCGCNRNNSGRLGPKIFTKSIRSVNTTLSSPKNQTNTIFSRRKSEVPMKEMKVLQPTDV